MIADQETAPPENIGPCPESGFGAALREARQAQGLDIPAIANRLKIRSVYLRALEAEDVTALPARPFAIGFLRSYARLLKLNPDPLVATLKRRLDGENDSAPSSRHLEAPASPPVPVSDGAGDARGGRKERSATFLLSPLLFAAAALGLGFALPTGTSSGESQARVAAVTADQSGDASRRPNETASGKATALPARKKNRPAPERATGRSAGRPAETAARDMPKNGKRHAVAAVAFRVRAGAWVLVKDGRGRPLWSGMLSTGQLWTPPAEAVRMTTTHPGNLILLIDGVEKGALGVAARPLLDIPLARPALLAFLAERARRSRLVRAAR